MGSLSKICATCRKCRFVNTCQNKQMEAYAYIDKPAKVSAESVNTTNPLLNFTIDFAEALNRIDPMEMYKGTAMDGMDAFERQLRRFTVNLKDIKR